MSIFTLFFLFIPVNVHAQESATPTDQQTGEEITPPSESIPEVIVEETLLKAKAGKDRNVAIGRTVLFDASASTGPEGAALFYHWDFGDNTSAKGIDATHAYKSAGTYKVVLQVTTGEGADAQTSEDSITVSVQEHLVILISDQSVPEKEIQRLQDYGLTRGTLVIPIRDSGVDQEYLTVQNIAQQLLKSEEDLIASDIIITWTSGDVGLNSLIALSQISTLSNTAVDRFDFDSKAIVAVNNQPRVSSIKSAQRAFQVVQPKFIVVSTNDILDDVVAAGTSSRLEDRLSQVRAEYQIISAYTARGFDRLTPLNFMSYAMNFMIHRGVPINSLFLILMLPVMATIIATARQLVGIKAFGIFAPTVIALSFLSTGLKYGLTVFFVVVAVGTLSRIFARKFRLLYLPRMAIVLSIIALAIFALFFVGAYFHKTGFIAISIFPILIMTVLTEHFVSVQIEQGYKAAIKLMIETVVLSLLGYFIGDWTLFKSLLLAYPELILLTLIFNYIIGKFSGLRLVEYIRFRNVFKHARHVEKS
ncbi:MAG: PKD domain-containing protein [Candidatus Kerfeldbacteria bacterium]|nr:PKD domain-containing protein [Candidatus Kerfeldbacteria bacterium]